MGRETLDVAQPGQPLANLIVTDLKRLAGNLVRDLNLEGTHPVRGAEFAVDFKEAPVEGRTEHMVLQPRLHTKPDLAKSAATRILISNLPNPLRHVAVVCDRDASAPGREWFAQVIAVDRSDPRTAAPSVRRAKGQRLGAVFNERHPLERGDLRGFLCSCHVAVGVLKEQCARGCAKARLEATRI